MRKNYMYYFHLSRYNLKWLLLLLFIYTSTLQVYANASSKGKSVWISSSVTVVNQQAAALITNIAATSGRSYTLAQLTAGTTLYTDRTHQVTAVPSVVNNAAFIRTPNDDKKSTSSTLLSFELSQASIVYVAYDPRATALPAWLSGWKKLTEVVNVNDPGTSFMNLYSKTFPAGVVNLGGNLASPAAGSQMNYMVLATADITTTACVPISTLPCDQVTVSLPVNLTFNEAVANTIKDKNGLGTGFTLVDKYSGTRLSADGTPTNSSVPGYEAGKLTLSSGRLQLVTNKGQAYQTNNNQLNALGVKIDSRQKLQVETIIVNPFNGTSSQQAGLWFGLSDKTFVKLTIRANKLELRRELNDVTGTASTDVHNTTTITGLDQKTVRLRLVIDPATNTAEGFYSVDGVNYVNVGAAYTPKTLSIANMGLTSSTAYAGIFATHNQATTPVTYNFDSFSVKNVSTNTSNRAPAFAAENYSYSISENVALGTSVGQVKATDPDGNALTYTIVSGNTNRAFSLNSSTGTITLAKSLNYHTQNSYTLSVRAADSGGLSDVATVVVKVSAGSTIPNFSQISWGTVASQPYGTHEVHGEVVNGKVYVFSGYDVLKRANGYWTPTKRAYVYDPATNKWQAIADLPHTPKGADFGGITHVGLTTDGTDIYFAGGYPSNTSGTGQTFATKQAWKYNVASNTYTALPSLPMDLAGGQMRYLKGKIHYIGGTDRYRKDVGVHYALDLDDLAAGWKSLAPLTNPRNHPGSAVYEGKIYFIGGAHNQDPNAIAQKDINAYDPNTNTWTRLADLPVGRDHISSSVIVVGNRILVMGGQSSGKGLNSVTAYSPADNKWSELTPLPAVRVAGVAALVKGVIYYIGGSFSKTTYKGLPVQPATTRMGNSTVPENVVSTDGDMQLNIFPNPNSGDNVFIEVANFAPDEAITISLQDVLGHLIQSANAKTDEQGKAKSEMIIPSTVNAGVYIIKAQARSGHAQSRLILK